MAHIAFAFILCALLALRWPVFGGRNTVLVMIGAILPDIFKLYIPLQLFHIYAQDSLMLFHIPIGTLLVCGLCALLFEGERACACSCCSRSGWSRTTHLMCY
jgi:hypothetical protein